VAKAHLAPAARTHVPPAKGRRAAPPAPVPAVAPAKGNSVQGPGHTDVTG
jgi:hypothetical protein